MEAVKSKGTALREFPGGPVIEAAHFHCRGPGSPVWELGS